MRHEKSPRARPNPDSLDRPPRAARTRAVHPRDHAGRSVPRETFSTDVFAGFAAPGLGSMKGGELPELLGEDVVEGDP